MPISAGERLGPYEILASIGAGGMGEVYKARDTRLGREVAIKISAEQFSERFEREARAIAALNHPNICQLYDVGPNYLVMELVEGESPQGPFLLETALGYARQIADALEAAHEKNIVHRDLKPGNIKVKPDGTVKVLDFGLAKVVQASSSVSDNPDNSPTISMAGTQAGMILGTAAYMSPEQARGKPVDRRSDIWAFGCVLYELLTGKRAFSGETTSDILVAVISKEPDVASVPVHLRPIVERCLRKEPRKRWQAIGDARIALEEAQPVAETAEETQPRGGPTRLPWVIAAVAAVLAALLAFVHFREKPPIIEPVRFQIQPPEQNRFGVAFALSPDGKKLAFPATGPDGRSFLWVRSLDSLEPKLLPGTEGATFLPFWSFDNRYVVFAAGGKLKKIEAAGGPPQALCDAPAVVTGGSWSPEGVILFSSNNGVILRVPEAGGTATPVTALAPGETYHAYPLFLPDGRHFIYARHSTQAENSLISVGALDAKPEEQRSNRLLSAGFAIYAPSQNADRAYLLFVRERSLMAQPFDAGRLQLLGEAVPIADPVGLYVERGLFSVSARGTLAYQATATAVNRLTWFDRQGKVLSYATDIGSYDTLALSPDATRVAAQRRDLLSGNQDIWLIDLLRGGSTRFTFDPAAEFNPVWSPDGRRIVFSSNRGGHADLYQKDSSGAGTEEALLKSNDNKGPQDWSRDSRYLIYSQPSPKTGVDLWTLAMTGERKPIPFLQSQFNEDQAQFSPDGHWVAYMSDASGKPEIYVRPFPASEGGGQSLISNGGGTEPRWRGDGKELFYFSGRKLMGADVAVTASFRAGVPKVLFEAPISNGTSFGNAGSRHHWDVTADGKRFLINTDAIENNSAPINVVLNWTAGLKK